MQRQQGSVSLGEKKGSELEKEGEGVEKSADGSHKMCQNVSLADD